MKVRDIVSLKLKVFPREGANLVDVVLTDTTIDLTKLAEQFDKNKIVAELDRFVLCNVYPTTSLNDLRNLADAIIQAIKEGRVFK